MYKKNNLHSSKVVERAVNTTDAVTNVCAEDLRVHRL